MFHLERAGGQCFTNISCLKCAGIHAAQNLGKSNTAHLALYLFFFLGGGGGGGGGNDTLSQ